MNKENNFRSQRTFINKGKYHQHVLNDILNSHCVSSQSKEKRSSTSTSKSPLKENAITTPSKLPVQLKLLFPSEINDVAKVSSFLSKEMISKSSFSPKNILPILQTHQITFSTEKVNSGHFPDFPYPPSINLIHSPYLNELRAIIPSSHYPKEGNDILRLSPYDVSGINVPSIVLLFQEMSLSYYFTQTEVPFRRYIMNFGAGTIRHIVVPFKIEQPLSIDFSVPLDEVGEQLKLKGINYYDFTQSPGDVVIIEPSTYHIAKASEDTIFATWCRCEIKNMNSFLASISFTEKIPMYPIYIRLANEYISDVGDNKENLVYIFEILLSFAKTQELSNVRYEPYTMNINFCDICKKEIFIVYYNVNGKHFCRVCYLEYKERKDDRNDIPASFYLKYNISELEKLIARLKGNQSNDKEEETKRLEPQEYFINYFIRKEQYKNYGSFAYYHPNRYISNDILSNVSEHLKCLHSKTLTQEEVNSVLQYIEDDTPLKNGTSLNKEKD